MTIALRLILVSTLGWMGSFAWSQVTPADNQQFVDHLNYYYQDLNLSVPNQQADPEAVNGELSSLELILSNPAAATGQLNSLDCNNPACCGGGCCGSVCERPEPTK